MTAQIFKFDTTHSPVALYQFDGNTNDSSGNGYDLTAVGAGGTVLEYRDVWPGLVALTRGFPARPAFDAALAIAGDMTIQAICVIRNAPVPIGAVCACLSLTSPGGDIEVNNVQYALNLPSQNGLNFASEHGAGVDDAFTVTPGKGLPAFGVPFYVAVVRESNVVRFYVNGVQYGSASAVRTAPTGGGNSVLCVRQADSLPSPEVASLKICDVALSQAEIEAEWNLTMGAAFGEI